MFGFPGFGSVALILWLMIAKPSCGEAWPTTGPTILVLGATGLIGQYSPRICVTAASASSPPRAGLRPTAKSDDVQLPIIAMTGADLAGLVRTQQVDVIVNCLGVLQDGPGSDTATSMSLLSRG